MKSIEAGDINVILWIVEIEGKLPKDMYQVVYRHTVQTPYIYAYACVCIDEQGNRELYEERKAERGKVCNKYGASSFKIKLE